MLHRLRLTALGVEQVGKIVFERRLAMTIALALAPVEGVPHQHFGRVEVPGIGLDERERVEGGDANPRIGRLVRGRASVDLVDDGERCIEVQASLAQLA